MANGFSVPDGATLNAMEKAGAPKREVSALKAWYDRTLVNGSGEQSRMAVAKLHVAAAGEALRAGGEGVLTGGILGAVHAKLPGGLDAKIGTGANVHQVPIDAIVGVAGLAGAVFGASTPGGKDLQNVGATALGIFTFRKVNDLTVLAAAKAAGAALDANGRPVNQAFHLIGHPQFSGERSTFGWAPGSARPRGASHGADWGEDPIAAAARGV